MTTPEREEKVEARIQRILAHRDFPALSDQVREVIRLSEDEDAALDRLADLVLRNYGLTLRVLRAVNSIHYNRSGQPILSVARAIILLGVRTVRDMAASFLVFDHYQRQSSELKRLMLLSMVTAGHAEILAQFARGVSAEEAYVCGMFRNLGEVLIAHHFPEDYAKIEADRRASGDPGAETAVRLLGFHYEDLGAAMAHYWGMPVVGETMLPMGTGSGLRSVTALGHGLTTLVYRGAERASEEEIKRLLDRHKRDLPVPAGKVDDVVRGAAAMVRKLFTGLGATARELEILGRSDPAVQPAVAEDADRTTGSGYGPISVKEAREPLLGEIAAATAPADLDIRRVMLMVLEALQRGGPFDRVLFCLLDDDRAEVRARLSLGEGAEAMVERFRFPIGNDGRQSPIGTVMIDREPLFVTLPTAGPREARLARALGAAELGVLPLTVEGKSIGCLYCDRRVPGGALDPGTLIFLGRVQAAAEQAITRSRQHADAMA